jgi:mRNA interferase MazF
MDMVIHRFDVWLISLDATVGKEMQKTRPCIVISPDEINRSMGVVIAAPLTTTVMPFPFRYNIAFKNKHGQVALDQLRMMDKSRLVKKIGVLPAADAEAICNLLLEMFSYE